MGILARYAPSIGAAAALLAGCGGSQSPISEPRALAGLTDARHIFDPGYKVSSGLLYVALYNPGSASNKVQIYNTSAKNPSPIASITEEVSQPQSACIDGGGTLYVVNSPAGAGWISEYALGKTKAFRTITQGIDGPSFCAIDSSGNLWVTNLNIPNVTEYLKGSASPHTTIAKGITYPIGIAIDHAGNVYVSNNEAPVNIQVYAPNTKSPSRTITDGLLDPIGIAVDANATLYAANYTQSGSIQEYRSGQSKPYRTITKEMNGPSAVTLAPNGRMYLTNTGIQGGSGPAPAILEFRPGSVKPAKKMITKGLDLPFGTAYYPALLP